jgi:Protein of unknown function (DUF3086)
MNSDDTPTPTSQTPPASEPPAAESLPVSLEEGTTEHPADESRLEAEAVDEDGDRFEENPLALEKTEQTEEEPSADSIEETTAAPTPETARPLVTIETQGVVVELEQRVAELWHQEKKLREEVVALQADKQRIQEQQEQLQAELGYLVSDSLNELKERKQALKQSIEQLERRQERIRTEMRTTFAGASQDLAMRVQGFKEYLVGSLQDLASTAEQLELAPPKAEPTRTPPRETARESFREAPREAPREAREAPPQADTPTTPQFAKGTFQEQTRQIRRLLDRYRHQPDYYGPAWQLRRTFEPIHAERVANWFLTQGGRGALRALSSRLQNVLIASACISILYDLYDRRLCTLVLANSPERLGEWRRGLQDCLGISRADFGPERGVVLFEDPEPLAQKADRLVRSGRMPLILIDESEDKISLSLLQFPLWLAFAPAPSSAPASAPPPDSSNFY